MDLLPPRPYTLQRSWALKTRSAGAFLLVLLSALGALMAGFGGRGALDHLAERKVWESGEAAAWVEVGGKQTKHTVLGLVPFMYEYDLELTFEDAEGTEHKAELEFDTLFAAASTDGEAELRYDPADPARIALSWGQESALARWGWTLLMVALGAGMIGGGVLTTRVAWRTVASARACGADGVELRARVVALEEVKGGKYRLTVELPGTLRRRAGKVTVTLDGRPIVVDGAAVGLESPSYPGLPTFPRADLHPYVATSAQRAALMQRLAGGAERVPA